MPNPRTGTSCRTQISLQTKGDFTPQSCPTDTHPRQPPQTPPSLPAIAVTPPHVSPQRNGVSGPVHLPGGAPEPSPAPVGTEPSSHELGGCLLAAPLLIFNF